MVCWMEESLMVVPKKMPNMLQGKTEKYTELQYYWPSLPIICTVCSEIKILCTNSEFLTPFNGVGKGFRIFDPIQRRKKRVQNFWPHLMAKEKVQIFWPHSTRQEKGSEFLTPFNKAGKGFRISDPIQRRRRRFRISDPIQRGSKRVQNFWPHSRGQ